MTVTPSDPYDELRRISKATVAFMVASPASPATTRAPLDRGREARLLRSRAVSRLTDISPQVSDLQYDMEINYGVGISAFPIPVADPNPGI